MQQKGEHFVEIKGTIVETLSGSKVRVELENGQRVLAGISGKCRLDFTRILPGKKVLIEFQPYNLEKSRIVRVIEESAYES